MNLDFPEIEDFEDELTPEGVNYFAEDVDFKMLHKQTIATWIEKAVKNENKVFHGISYIFCSDEYLHKINMEHLEHDDYTDVITFPYSEKRVEGDIFISIERIAENAVNQGVTTENELHRVMIHGAMHLCGYTDKTPEDKELMTAKENFYLAKLTIRKASVKK
jgi:probable rRNA maturation factor